MLKVASGLAEAGHAVDLIAINPTGHYRRDDFGKVRLIELGVIPLKGLTVLNAVRGLARYLRAVRPDAVISATTAVNIIVIFARLLSGASVKTIVSERNAIQASAITASRAGRLYRALIPWIYPKADVIVAVSQGVGDELVRDFAISPSKVKVVYNPVVSDGLVAQSRREVADPWLNDRSVPLILSVGRLHPQKDIPTLLRAFALLLKRREIRLIILGEGRWRGEYERLASALNVASHLKMPGFVDNPYAYMGRANLFVMASRYEGICNVLIEALACGCRVVATDCPGGGPREILEDGKWGRLVPVGDVPALALAMEKALAEPHEAAPLVARAGFFSDENGMAGYRQLIWEH
jgi:glycosyltransferase involved in cell wall biosynthesis